MNGRSPRGAEGGQCHGGRALEYISKSCSTVAGCAQLEHRRDGGEGSGQWAEVWTVAGADQQHAVSSDLGAICFAAYFWAAAHAPLDAPPERRRPVLRFPPSVRATESEKLPPRPVLACACCHGAAHPLRSPRTPVVSTRRLLRTLGTRCRASSTGPCPSPP